MPQVYTELHMGNAVNDWKQLMYKTGNLELLWGPTGNSVVF